MSAIVQELGFDASSAISEISKLNKSYAALESRTLSLAKALGGLNSVMASTPGAFGNLANQAQGLNASLGKIAPTASAAGKNLARVASPQVQQQFAATVQHSQRLTTSVQLLSRIVFTQAVIRGLRLLESNFVSAGEKAHEFQLRMAEVQAVSNGAFGSLDRIASAVRKISDETGRGLDDTGTALREIVGAQVGAGDPTAQLDVLKEAASLSKSGISTLAESGALLSSVLNGFKKDTAEVGKISSQIFKATDLGVLTVGQLEHAIGRVIPRAQLLGVSFEEVLAAFSSLTRAGVNPNEAATQIGNVLTSFAKPSKGMTAALHELGAASSQELLASKGLAGALQSVIGTTDGSAESVAKLFRSVQALNGALALGVQRIADFRSDTKQIQDVPANLSRDQAKIIQDVDGEKVAREINKIKNAFNVDFGQSVLRTSVQLSSFIGGADGVIKVMQAIGPAAIGAGAGVGILAARTRLGVAEGTALFGVLGKLAGGLTALGLAATGGELLGNKIADSLFGDFRKKVEENISALQRFRDAQQNLIASSQQSNTERIRSALASGEGLDLERLSKIVNRPVTESNQAGALTEARDRLTAFQQIVAAADNAQKKISQLRGEIRASDVASTGFLGTIGRLFSGPNAGPAVAAVESIRNEILKLSQSGEVTEEQIASLQKRVAQVKTFAGNTPATKLGFQTEAAALDGALQRLQQIRELQKSVPGADRARQQAQEIQSFLTDLPIASFNQMQAALGAGVGASAGIAANLERAAAAAKQAAAAAAAFGGGGEGEEGFFHGGLVKPIYRATGGPVGSDRVPAWLTAGEMVVNRGATSRFFSQLTSMNAGNRPAAGNRVGDTTFNMGDINVTGGPTNDATGRAIANVLRREARRGAIVR